jgi:hypothetical protein
MMISKEKQEFEARSRSWEHNLEARNQIRTDNANMEAAMFELALCCRDLVVRRPHEGADLGAILIGYKFKGILEKQGLAIVPVVPTQQMQVAWKKGWLRSFYERYSAMLLATWRDNPPNQRAG